MPSNPRRCPENCASKSPGIFEGARNGSIASRAIEPAARGRRAPEWGGRQDLAFHGHACAERTFALVARAQDFSNARWLCLAKRAGIRARAFACAQVALAPARPSHSEESADELWDEIGRRDASEITSSAECTGPRTRQKRAISSKVGGGIRRWAQTFEDGPKIARPKFGPSSKIRAAG
jgi:hypothetical protein